MDNAEFLAQATIKMQQAVLADATAAASAEPEAASGEGGGETAAVEKAPAKAEPAKATPTRGAGGKFVAGGKGGEPAAPAPAAKTEPTKAQAQAAEVDEATSKLEALKELAKSLGYTLEETRVSVAERAAFREQRRTHQQQIQQLEQEAHARAAQIIQDANLKAGPALRAMQAWEAGDYDGFAKALGKGGWNDLEKEAIARYTDPNYKRVQELEAWKRQQEETVRQQNEQAQQARLKAQQDQQIEAYKSDLSGQMAQSTDPLLAAFHDDPLFINAVFRVQQSHFDGNATVTPEEAVRIKPKQGGDPLFEEMRRLYSRLSKAFSAGQNEREPAQAGSVREAQTPEPAKAGSGRAAPVPVRQSKPSTSIPQRKATEAAGPGKFKSDKDFLAYAQKRLMEAIAEDK